MHWGVAVFVLGDSTLTWLCLLLVSVDCRTRRSTWTSSTATWRCTAPCMAPAPCTSPATSRTTGYWAAETCSSSSERPRWAPTHTHTHSLLADCGSHKPTPTLDFFFLMTMTVWWAVSEDTLRDYFTYSVFFFSMCQGLESSSEHP